MDSRVLLVHGNPGLMRTLEGALRSEGHDVQSAQSSAEGLKIFQTVRPGMVLTDVAIGEPDGFAFISRLREDPIGKTAALLLLDKTKGPGRRLRAVRAGADSRLAGPDPTRELMARARLLFGSPKREADGGVSTAPRGFACDLADLDVLDLVALGQRNGRSGVATLTAPGRATGSLFFDQGRLIDAQAGHSSGMEAFHRLACWTEGALNLEWRNFRRRDALERSTGDLVTSGLERIEEWTQLLTELGSP
ncbi:MAG TPA: response regulator, partial [Polyangia bacterium]|nr:response regulator [Polyangia bacterium]